MSLKSLDLRRLIQGHGKVRIETLVHRIGFEILDDKRLTECLFSGFRRKLIIN